MDETVLAQRVEMLEETARALVAMPARMAGLEGRLDGVERRLTTVETQIVQLRAEMRGEFSAIRGEMHSLIAETRQEMHALHAVTGERFDALYEQGEDTRRYMRVLHEEVLDRIAQLGEGRSAL